MNSWFKRLYRPTRIKSLKELQPGFTPKWCRYSFKLVLAAMTLAITMVVSGFFNIYWIYVMTIWSLVAVVVSLALLESVPPVLRVVAYYWPWLGLKSAQLDSWLELDLEWGPPK